jgi:hypothetical protein
MAPTDFAVFAGACCFRRLALSDLSSGPGRPKIDGKMQIGGSGSCGPKADAKRGEHRVRR